jgi:hypothetical protein
MHIIKNITRFLIQPFRLVSHKNISEKISVFFAKHPIWVYVFSFALTLLVIYLYYRS